MPPRRAERSRGVNPTGGSVDASIPLIIDCDPGIDDAIALALAVASREVDLLAVSTVAGNAQLETTTRNAVRLLGRLGRVDVPSFQVPGAPLVRTSRHGLVSPHGESGLGGVDLPGRPE